MATREQVSFKIPLQDFGVSSLPSAVKSRWQPFRGGSGQLSREERSLILKDASFHIYRTVKERPHSKHWHLKLADVSSRGAAAAKASAADLASSQSDGDRSAVLASHILASMQAAEQRRLEARQAQRARLVAKRELTKAKLTQSQCADQARRQQLLQQLLGKLANAEQQRQAVRAQKRAKIQKPTRHLHRSSSNGQLRRIVAVRGTEDWMTDLSPKTAASAAFFRVNASTKCVQRTWRRFASTNKTTAQLACTFVATGITGLTLPTEAYHSSPSSSSGGGAGQQLQQQAAAQGFIMVGGLSGGSSFKHGRFEDFAAKLQSPNTLRAAQALLKRLDQRLSVRGVTADGAQSLLRQLNPSAPKGKKLERYPVRVMLCAYMIQAHPEVVFNALGDIEARLSAAADKLLAAFEALLARLVQPLPSSTACASSSTDSSSCSSPTAGVPGPMSCQSPLTKSMASYIQAGAAVKAGPAIRPVSRQLFTEAGSSRPESSSGSGAQPSLASLLVSFDQSWLEYLDQFVVWKGHDARGLETELIRMAIRLERSVRVKLGRREPDSPEVTNNPDLRAMVEHVCHDHALLAERIARLTGPDGSSRLALALEHVRQQVAAELEAAEAAEAAAAQAAEANSEASLDSPQRPRVSPRSLSRRTSLQDPISDAQALEAASKAAAQQDSLPTEEAPKSTDPAVQQPDALSNEAMVWEMLYTGDSYALPTAEAESAWRRAMGKEPAGEQEFDPSDVDSMTPQQLTAMVSSRAREIAERAFWDSIVWRFKMAVQGQALPGQIAPLLSELGTELGSFVTDSIEAQHFAEQYTEAAILARLTSRTGQQGAGANLTALGAMMEQLAQTLLRSGTPERAAESAEVTQQLQQRLAAALGEASSSSAGGAPAAEDAAVATALAEALAAALRLLMTQLKVVKLDAANARLAGLARAMRERGAVSYLQTKLAAAWRLAPTQADSDRNTDAATSSSADVPEMLTEAVVTDKLPRTAEWVRGVQSGMMPQLRSGLSAAGLLLDQAAAAAAVVAGGLQAVELRSGVRASPSSSAGRQASMGASPKANSGNSGPIKPAFPVAADSWQGAVRAGLLALVTADTPAVGPALPEVFAFDAARLHELQNNLQQLMVTAASLLIVQQLRNAAGLPWDAEMRAQARRRLLVVLADPGMKLPHLVTELSQLAGAGAVATEQRVTTMFTTIVNPEAAAFKSIRSAISCALAAHLLYGRAAMAADGTASSSCTALLGRVGAAALAEDVADLGERLAGVAAVNEAVHGHMLALLGNRQ